MSKVKCNVTNPNGSITAQRVAEARNKMGLNQKKFGEKLAEKLQRRKPFSIAAVSAWETARKAPMLNVIIAVSDLSGYSIEYLTGAENNTSRAMKENAFNEPNENTDIAEKIKDSEIAYKSIPNYDGKPVFAVFEDKKYPDGWALLDANEKVLVFRDKKVSYGDLNGLKLYPLETYSYKSFMKRNERPLGVQEFREATGKFWVEMTTSDLAVRTYYDGWYIWNQGHNAIVNMANGEVLPARGFSISYKVYMTPDQRV